MKKRRKGRVREFEQAEMRRSMESMQRERRESRQPEPELEPEMPVTYRKNKKVRINKGRIILTVIVIVLIAVVGMSIKNVFDLRAEQKQLQHEQKLLLQEKEALKEELKNVNDLDYIEEQARIQLRMIKPGEILYITESTLKENLKAGGDNTESNEDDSNSEDN